MLTPYYSYHIGNKSEVFNGIKIYLTDFKRYINERKKENIRINKIIENNKINLELELNKQDKDIESITFINREIETLRNIYLKEEGELSNNNTKFILDLCDLLL